uniref:SH3 domain-containing protein n=1 Tax=Panagrolaimus sp. JU765 TaxID=591449 RepID=A0AC34PUQ0_9BILA
MRPHHSSSMHLPPPPQYGIGPRHGSMPFEGSSNGYPGPTSSRNPSGSNSYYYSSSGRPPQPLNAASFGGNPAAPSPGGHSYRTNPSVDQYPPPHSTATMMGRRTNSLGPSHGEADPSYQVEHLATFAVGRQFGLQSAQDGIRKLKQMEKQSAIWAQPLILKLLRDKISVEDENGDIVEQFPMRLVESPTAQQSQDKTDTYNNILLFVVKGDDRHPPGPPTEMHIFHCIGVSAKDVAQDIYYYTRGQIQKVRGGRRENAAFGGPVDASPYGPIPANYYRDDASPSSNSSEAIDMNVNTLNRCFDDIERFVARIQSAAIAQRELDMQRMRTRTKPRGKQEAFPPPGILNLRAQMPQYAEFFEIFQKFKLSFNILTLVKEYIHDPNAPELLHFLFTPLIVILDACHWGLGQPVAPQVVSPLLSFDAIELLRNCLTSKEFDVWMSLGPNWRTPPEEFRGPLPPPYRPVFRDNFAPYGYPQAEPPSTQTMHRGSSAPPAQRSVDNLEFERVNLEKERIAFERMKLLERERYLEEQEQRVRQEQARLEAERDLLQREGVKQRRPSQENYQAAPSPGGKNGHDSSGISPKMRAFLSDLLKHNRKIVEVTYDRVKQHEKELTVIRGEYLDVLSDEKNWWECRNSQNNVGFVPHTILSVITPEDAQALLSGAGNGHINPDQIPQRNPPGLLNSQSLSPRPGMMSEDTPDYIKQRQGKRGEFRYF